MSAPQSNLSNWTIGQQHHPIRTGSRAIWSFRPLCQIAVTQNLTPYTTGEGFGYSKRSHRLPCHRLADGQSGAPFSLQIPAGAANAPGSSLGFWRRSDAKAEGAVS
jgi:hypothetical protein